MDKQPSLFLSYSSSDRKFAERLAAELNAVGVKVWIDQGELKLGDSLIDRIREGIDQMDYLAVVISPAAVMSEWVKREVEIAMHQEIEGKRVKVLPLLYKECDLPWFLKGKLYADFTKPDLYQASLLRIFDRLGVKKSPPFFVNEVGTIEFGYIKVKDEFRNKVDGDALLKALSELGIKQEEQIIMKEDEESRKKQV